MLKQEYQAPWIGHPADEPKPMHTCNWCHEGIYEGERYYEINDEIICENCINDCRHIA